MGTKKQADAVEAGQLMALFGETPESVDKIVADAEKETGKKLKQPAPLTAKTLTGSDNPDTEIYNQPKTNKDDA